VKNYYKSVLDLTIRVIFISVFSQGSWAKNRPYQEMLKQIFPDCERKKENIFLTKEQQSEIEEALEQKIHSPMALRYHLKCADRHLFAYIDSHIVRTMNQTVVVGVNAEGKITHYKISSFMEPSEYRPPKQWIEQILDKGPQDKYQLNHEIDALSGATLSANAVVNSSKKIIKLHQVLRKKSNP